MLGCSLYKNHRKVERMKKIKKFLCLFLAFVMTFPAVETNAANVENQRVITGFAEFDINENALHLLIDYKPTLTELKEMMPETLDVYLNDGLEAEALKVDWFCVGEDYENSDNFYFQFSPIWDEEAYVLSDEIELLTEAPYIAVFFKTEQDAASTYAVTGNSNETIIFKYLTETLGYNTAAACGAMANIYCESSFIPNNLQNSYEKKLGFTDASYTVAVDSGSYKNFVNDKAGYGLCQWTYNTRKQGLLDLAKSMKTSIGDAVMQLKFLGQELKACATGKYMKGIENSAQGAYEVGYYYCQKFERPYQKEDEVSIYRGNLAKNTYWTEYYSLSGHIHEWEKEPTIDIEATCTSSGSQSIHCVKCDDRKNIKEIPKKGHCWRAWVVEKKPTNTEEGKKKRSCSVCAQEETRVIANLLSGGITGVFSDVQNGEWYLEAVRYVYGKGIMSGVSDTTFEPETAVTRATIVQTLYKLAGKPAVEDFTKYESLNDHQDSIWWKNGLAWALNTGVAKGDTKNNVFNPDNKVTREDLATFIYRYAQYQGMNVELEKTVEEILGDTFVNSWAKTAFAWTIETGLIKGKTINGVSDLAPQVGATRAELATIMMRFYKNNDL